MRKPDELTGMESARVYPCENRARNLCVRASPYITHYFSCGTRKGIFTGKWHAVNSDTLSNYRQGWPDLNQAI